MLLGVPLQTAYVTTDLDRACALLGARYGVEKFLRVGPVTVETDAGDAMTLALAHAWIGNTWLEIIQPIAGAVTLFSDWLVPGTSGVRFHHLGIRIPDTAAWDAMVTESAANGHRTIFSITRNRNQRVCYIDTAAELGHYVEYLYIPDVEHSTMAKMPQNLPGFATIY